MKFLRAAFSLICASAMFGLAAVAQPKEQVIGLGKPLKSNIPSEVMNIFRNKTTMMVKENKMGKTNGYIRFTLRPEMIITTKAANGKQQATLQTTFYLVDLLEKEAVLTKVEMVFKGTGTTAIEAQKAAINTFNVTDAASKKFAEDVKAKIEAYYNTRCDDNIAKAREMVKTGHCSEALEVLDNIPENCKECTQKTNSVIAELKKGRCKGAPKYYNISANASVDGVSSATRTAQH
jgi:hypothetical protein